MNNGIPPDALDCWPTPSWVTRILLPHLPPDLRLVIEPQAGAGSISRVLLDRGLQVISIDATEEYRATLKALPALDIIRHIHRQHEVIIADTLGINYDNIAAGDEYGIIANPPWRPSKYGLLHLRHMLSGTPRYVAALIPTYWLSGGSGRLDFWKEYPPTGIGILPRRPRFVAGGGKFEVVWVIWDRRKYSLQPGMMVIDG